MAGSEAAWAWARKLENTIARFGDRLEKRGLTAFDPTDERDRSRAIRASIEASLEDLEGEELARLSELVALPENEDTPIKAAETLWAGTAGIAADQSNDLLLRFHSLSLLQSLDLEAQTFRVHPIIISYLRSRTPPETIRVAHAAMDRANRDLRKREFALPSAAFSPDGARIVTASRDSTARIWDARSGAELNVLRGHEDSVEECGVLPGWSPHRYSVRDNTARIWDARSIVELLVLRGHEDPVGSAGFSRTEPASLQRLGIVRHEFGMHNRARNSTSCAGMKARLRVRSSPRTEPSSLQRPGTTRHGSGMHDRMRNSTSCAGMKTRWKRAEFSPDGALIVTASRDNTARIWDARSIVELLVLRGHEHSVGSAEFSPDGTRIVTASWDRTARIWDARSGAELRVLRGHEGWVRKCGVFPGWNPHRYSVPGRRGTDLGRCVGDTSGNDG